MLLTPYLGQQRQDVAKDSFNFYLSQCSIQIEQAFVQLTNVWRVFKLPLRLHFNLLQKKNFAHITWAGLRLLWFPQVPHSGWYLKFSACHVTQCLALMLDLKLNKMIRLYIEKRTVSISNIKKYLSSILLVLLPSIDCCSLIVTFESCHGSNASEQSKENRYKMLVPLVIHCDLITFS
jgi:hypothetical protein